MNLAPHDPAPHDPPSLNPCPQVLDALPTDTHPMTQLSMAVMALQVGEGGVQACVVVAECGGEDSEGVYRAVRGMA